MLLMTIVTKIHIILTIMIFQKWNIGYQNMSVTLNLNQDL